MGSLPPTTRTGHSRLWNHQRAQDARPNETIHWHRRQQLLHQSIQMALCSVDLSALARSVVFCVSVDAFSQRRRNRGRGGGGGGGELVGALAPTPPACYRNLVKRFPVLRARIINCFTTSHTSPPIIFIYSAASVLSTSPLIELLKGNSRRSFSFSSFFNA